MSEAQSIISTAEKNSPEWDKAKRDLRDAKQQLEWYEGHWEIPDAVRKEAVALQRESLDENGNYTPFMELVDLKRCKFIKGVIQVLSEEALRLQEASNLGERFLDRTFATFDKKRNPLAFAKASAYVNSENILASNRNSLLFIGGTGTGKTHLAAAIANRLAEIGVPTRFGTFQAHLDSIKKEFDVSGQGKYLDDIKSIPMLVIDDLGQEHLTDWSRSQLYDIVNYRYEHKLPLIITTNLNADEIANRYGGAVWSRFNEMCDSVVMGGSDYRKERR